MALNVNQTQQANQQQQAAPQQQQQAQQQAAPQPRFSTATNIANSFRRSGRVDGGDARSAEALQILQRLKKESVDNQDLEENFQILRFDRDANQVGISSLLVVKTVKINGKVNAFVRPLMMPNNSIKLGSRKVQFNQAGFGQVETIEVEVEPSDVFTPNYWNRIVEFVKGTLGQPDAVVFSVGAYVIPGEFDLKEEHLLKQILIRSVNFCDDLLARQSGEQPFTVSMIKSDQEILSANLDFSGTPVTDQLGNPVRSDIIVSTKRVRKDNQQENEFYESDSTINQVSLMVDLEYAPQQQQAMFGQNQMQQVPPCTAGIVITSVTNAPWIKANTPELYLFALSNAFRVTSGQSWARKFIPEVGKTKDLRDIGALGYLSPQGKKIDTKTETFTNQHFAELMFNMVKPNPVFMIDLDPMGDNGFLDSVMLDAMGGPNQAKAKATIGQAMTNLVGQDFKQFFDYTKEAILLPYGSTVNKGYYYDADEKRDRRDLDVLGALNASEGNQQEWLSWYATQCSNATHAELRNRQSKNFDRQYLGQVVYTGRAVRAIINPNFVQAIDAAINAAGLAIVMDNIAVSFGAQRFQGNANIGNFAVSGVAAVTNSFGNNGNFATYQPYSVGTGSFYG